MCRTPPAGEVAAAGCAWSTHVTPCLAHLSLTLPFPCACSTSKELVRDGRPGDTFPLLAEGLQVRPPAATCGVNIHSRLAPAGASSRQCPASVVGMRGQIWRHELAALLGMPYAHRCRQGALHQSLAQLPTCLFFPGPCSWHRKRKTCGQSGRWCVCGRASIGSWVSLG